MAERIGLAHLDRVGALSRRLTDQVRKEYLERRGLRSLRLDDFSAVFGDAPLDCRSGFCASHCQAGQIPRDTVGGDGPGIGHQTCTYLCNARIEDQRQDPGAQACGGRRVNRGGKEVGLVLRRKVCAYKLIEHCFFDRNRDFTLAGCDGSRAKELLTEEQFDDIARHCARVAQTHVEID